MATKFGLNDGEPAIRNWKQFAKHGRSQGCNLLRRLSEFPDAVLVAGCQRSGTTILTRTITQKAGMTDFWVGRDDELDAALILSGLMPHEPHGRYCFQTTYLNECYHEYFRYGGGFKLIWVVRNPRSVIYSLTYNWKRFALNELFDACGVAELDERYGKRHRTFGKLGVSPFMRACFSYTGKVKQVFELLNKLGPENVMVVEYEALATGQGDVLKRVFEFIGKPYNPEYAGLIHTRSLGKADKLSARQTRIIQHYCDPTYRRAKALAIE